MKTIFFKTTLLFLTLLSSYVFAATNLKLNLEQGKSYSFKTTSKQTVLMTMNGMQMNTDIISESVLSFNASGFETGYILMKVKYDSINNEISAMGRHIVVNSNKTGSLANAEEAMNPIMHRLCQFTVEVKMSYTGKVIEFINLKSVTDSVLKVFDSVPASAQMQIKPMAEMILSASTIKSTIESITGYLPENAVSKGDKWESKNTISANGMNLLITSTNKLKSIENGLASITGSATIEPSGDGKMIMGGMQMAYDLRGMGTSDIQLSTSTGLVSAVKSRQKLQGSITVNGNAMPMEVESNIETTIIK